MVGFLEMMSGIILDLAMIKGYVSNDRSWLAGLLFIFLEH